MVYFIELTQETFSVSVPGPPIYVHIVELRGHIGVATKENMHSRQHDKATYKLHDIYWHRSINYQMNLIRIRVLQHLVI